MSRERRVVKCDGRGSGDELPARDDSRLARHHSPLATRPSPLVIGYGNPLRGDDGFGWQIAQQLAGLLIDESVTVLAVQQLTPELAEAVGRASLVMFVDAHAGGRPGQLVVRALV